MIVLVSLIVLLRGLPNEIVSEMRCPSLQELPLTLCRGAVNYHHFHFKCSIRYDSS